MRIAVIGGGAAGLMAACRLTDAGADVTLFEKGDRVGRKLSITGKGRCNLTNRADARTVMDNVTTNPKFLFAALNAFPPDAVMTYFEETLGVPLKVERGSRVFPQSDKASDIVRALQTHAEKGGCRFVRARVTALKAENGRFVSLEADGKILRFDAAILAAGGCSYPATGSDGQGYDLAKALGHGVVPPKPSLVPLETTGELHKALMGLSLKNTRLTLTDKTTGKTLYSDMGEMLFTHFGLSGPMVLSASAHIREMQKNRYEILIDLKPALDEQTLDRRLLSDFEKYSNRDLINALSDLLPAKMIPAIVSVSGIDPHKKVRDITKAERRSLLEKIKELRFTVKGFRPIEEAIVTSGGIRTDEITPSTMESRLVKGLYFAGEIIDVDAYTGGFNLQIAFMTAALAASAIGKLMKAGEGGEASKDEKKDGRKMKKIINIAIDGPSGAGKSSLAKGLAKRYGLIYVDTGALYRTVGLYASRCGIPLDRIAEICAHLDKLKVGLGYESGEQHVYLFDEDVTGLIRTPEISMYASAVSAQPAVRAFLLETQRKLAREHSVVMDGRDIGTVILPDANVKIFLVADERKRAERRCKELLEKGVETTVEEVLADMKKRDANDRGRETAPAVPAKDAVLLDNSSISLEETIEAAAAIVEEKLK